MVNGISSQQLKGQRKVWTFVFCQFTLSPKDAASLSIVSSVVTSSSSSTRTETLSAKSRSVKELWPNMNFTEMDRYASGTLNCMITNGHAKYIRHAGECSRDFLRAVHPV